jgi:hypothetical protein
MCKPLAIPRNIATFAHDVALMKPVLVLRSKAQLQQLTSIWLKTVGAMLAHSFLYKSALLPIVAISLRSSSLKSAAMLPSAPAPVASAASGSSLC